MRGDGARNAVAVLTRLPSRMLKCVRQTPSIRGPLWSSVRGMPAATAASITDAWIGSGS